MLDRRKFLGLSMAGLAVLGLAGVAAAKLTAGREYVIVNPPQPTEAGAGKIEVVEFFWYGCPHCFDLEPVLDKWAKTLPKDVEFRRVPTIFRESWIPGARIYYALEAIGELPRLHGDVFNAIHTERINLNDEKILKEWMAKKGVDSKKFADAYNSFAVQTKTKRAQQVTQGYKITGVPAMAVDGKYLTSVSQTGSHEALTATLDQLIQQARAEKAKK